MSEFNHNGSDYDLEGLPSFVRRYQYQGKEHFSHILNLEHERLRLWMRTGLDNTNGLNDENPQEQTDNITEFIVFSIDPSTFEQDFLDPNSRPFPAIHYKFDPATNILVIKMSTHEHHQVAKALDMAIDDVLAPMGLHRAIFTYGGVKIDLNGVTKVPDWGWGPRRPPRGYPRRPTVVLEVAISESRAKLRRDVDLWLDPARGNSNIAIAVKSNRKRRTITLDKWEWSSNDEQSQRSRHIEIWENQSGEVVVSGSPLVIPFHLLFLRDAESPRETDLIIEEEQFKEIAAWVWEAHV
ncbi:hypothetical protein N7475_008655 [Penicillium sp. IBT 31633x]|nr:hypothetical protein N7475_008655 [Penicillium sp. IBT 31633x]